MIITEQSRTIPVINDVDICVIGGSCTGVFAAVRAARLGARVCVIEKNNCFGGAATAGFVCIWHSLMNTTREFPVIAGLTLEMTERLEKIGAIGSPARQSVKGIEISSFERTFNTEELKIELDIMIHENKITPHLHSFVCGAQTEGDAITHVIIENKSGRSAIKAKCFIDASGDGDVAYRLGLPYYAREGRLQPPTPCFKYVGLDKSPEFSLSHALDAHGEEFGLRKDHGWSVVTPDSPSIIMSAQTHIYNVDCSDANQLTFAEMEGRRQARAILQVIKKYASKGSETALVACNSNIGIRETRHFHCLHQLNEHEVLEGVHFTDAIANGTYRVDIHHSGNKAGVTFRYLNGVEEVVENRKTGVAYGRWSDKTEYPTYYQIPFSCQVTDAYRNLILAGRMVDADEGAFGAIRVMVNLNQLGESAGVAAWMACDRGDDVRKLDSARLRSLLKTGGSCVL